MHECFCFAIYYECHLGQTLLPVILSDRLVLVACGPAQQGMLLPSVDMHSYSCLCCRSQLPLTGCPAAQ